MLLTSCAGKGEPPDNGRQFYHWLMNNDDDASRPRLSKDVSYAVFGLGNESAHPNHYNIVGKQIDKRLAELGAHPIRDIGLGDDGGCIDGDFDEWMLDITKLISGKGGEDDHTEEELTEKSLNKEREEESDKDSYTSSSTNTRIISNSNKYPELVLDPPQSNTIRRDLFHLSESNTFYTEMTSKLKLIDNHILSPDAGESGLHEIRIALDKDYAKEEENNNNGLSYTTGDHVLLYPRNSDTIVNAYANMLNVDPHAIISEGNSKSYPYPTGITVAETLTHCIDLGAQPSPSFARKILGRKELDYINEIATPRRTIIDLCYQSGIKLLLEDFLYNAVTMKPRYYSIASSSIRCPDEVHVVFRPIHYMTSRGCLREGVCTSFMSHKGAAREFHDDTASCVPALINSNPSFRLPPPSTPVLFIGGGCGVAPIKAFLEERITLQINGHGLGHATLFLGFRSPQDVVYQELVQEALDLNALSGSEIVYSTGSDKSCQQMLVSDLVRQRSNYVWNHFKNGGCVYMCGGARTFGNAIESAFLDIFQEKGEMNFDDV